MVQSHTISPFPFFFSQSAFSHFTKGRHTSLSSQILKTFGVPDKGTVQNISVYRVFFNLLLFNPSVMSDSLQHRGLQHARLPGPSLFPRVCSDSCPLSWWCCLTISSSATPSPVAFNLSSQHQNLPMSQLFASGDQNIEASALASVLPMNILGWFPLGLIGLILQSKGLSRVFSSTIRKHQFFGTQPSVWSNSHIPIWLLEKRTNHSSGYTYLYQQSYVSGF